MPDCPVCNSENVRVSFNTPAWEFGYRWLGLQRYRCRECRGTFHHPLRPGEQFTEKPRRRRSSKHAEKLQVVLNGWQQKAFEGALFVVMVVVFYAALKVIRF